MLIKAHTIEGRFTKIELGKAFPVRSLKVNELFIVT